MDLSFANPAGFWALLGIPAIIAIHFLQRQSKVLTISTLFLVQQLTRESVRGRKLERIRNSVPLWLQLLMVLGLTWILVQPRWIRPESVQRIAVVLDSSASMSVFKEELKRYLRSELGSFATKVSRTEYVILDSAITDLSLYNGDDLLAMLATIDEWHPHSGAHDFAEGLRIARSLVGGEGMVILATDHLVETLPFNAKLLAVGDQKDNVGFAGYSVTELDDGRPAWRSVVRNYSDQQQTRNWVLTTGTQRSAARDITLEPGQSRTLEGAFPENAAEVTLHLETDAFALDDRLPLVLPKEKPLSLARLTPPELKKTIDQVVSSLGSVSMINPDSDTEAAQTPDLYLYSYDPLRPTLLEGNALILLEQVTLPNRYMTGRIAAENHPLITGLNWQGLIARRSPGVPPKETDTVLLWQDERALIFLRTEGGRRQLFLNFELATSNAANLPAFIVMMHRFVETLREEKVAPMAENYETGQPLDLAVQTSPIVIEGQEEATEPPPLQYRFISLAGENDANTTTVEETIPLTQIGILRAPEEPGFFQIAQGETVLLTAAAAFADTREADLREAKSQNDLSNLNAAVVEQHSESDSRWQIWLLAILFIMLVCWFFVEKKQPASATETDPDEDSFPATRNPSSNPKSENVKRSSTPFRTTSDAAIPSSQSK